MAAGRLINSVSVSFSSRRRRRAAPRSAALVPRARTTMPAYGCDSAADRGSGLSRGSSRGRGSNAAPARAGTAEPSIERRRGERQSRIAAINREMLNRVAGHAHVVATLSRRLDLPRPVGLAQPPLLHLPRVDFQIPGTVRA